MRGYFTNRAWFLAWLLLLLGLPSVLPAAERGLLFELNREGEAPSYLFGTMHADDPKVLATVERVATSFGRAKRLVLEVVLDVKTVTASTSGMMLPAEQSLAGLLGEKDFQRLVPLAAARGLDVQRLQRMKPWAVAITLSLPPSSGGPVLDQLLYLRAVEQGKPVHGLEDIQEQLAVFDRMPLALQQNMLVDVLNNYQQMPPYWQALLDAYLARDLERLELLGRQQMADMDDRVSAWFEQQVIQTRNQHMLERMLPLLEGGSAFVAVGALHLPGETGLLQGLQRNGFQLHALW